MSRPRTVVEAALSGKGFHRVEGDHHFFIYHTQDGKKTRARTKTSHTPKMKDISDNLLGQMARQVCLDTKADFLRLVDCPMSRVEFEGVLKAKGYT
jgi:hypothetical protein